MTHARKQNGRISPVTRQLLATAAGLAEMLPSAPCHSQAHPALAQFTRIYREWIIHHRGMSDAVELRAEQWRLMLYCMASASTLGEAIHLLLRFKRLVWDERVAIELRHEGRQVALVFNEPLEPGAEGLISALWPLSVHLTQFEFLLGRRLKNAEARVRNGRCLPGRTVALLFDRPIRFNASEVALVFPEEQLRRAVVVKAADIPAFAGHVMPALVRGTTQKQDRDLPSLVSSLLRNDRWRNPQAPAGLRDIAGRLGCSAVTLRRHLHANGVSFRQLKERVLDSLAKEWLAESETTIEDIAERIGYSDTSAFRRAFRRANGISPQGWRRSLAGPGRLSVCWTRSSYGCL